MDINLVVEAGRLAERRGWSSVAVVEPDGLGSVLPGPGEVIVVVPAGRFSLQHARDVAALSASGKSVAVVTADVLAEDVQAWLPHGSVHVAGSRRDVGGWSARAGLAALSWYGEDGIDECLVDGVLPSPPTGEDARTLARNMKAAEVGIAWDQPIVVPQTGYSSRVLNVAGWGAPIKGLPADAYLTASELDVVKTGSNPLFLMADDGRWVSALATLNLHIDGHPVLLACIPDFVGSDMAGDSSVCVIPEGARNAQLERSRRGLQVVSYQLSWLQANPGNPGALHPWPTWLAHSSISARSVLIGLCDLWASAFLSGFYLGGVEWFCRQGTDLDGALRADWLDLIAALESSA